MRESSDRKAFLDSGSPLRCGRNDEFSCRVNKIPIPKFQIISKSKNQFPKHTDHFIDMLRRIWLFRILNFGHWYLFEFCTLVLEFFMTFIKQIIFVNPVSYLLK